MNHTIAEYEMDKSSWIALAGSGLAIVIAALSAGYYFGVERERVNNLNNQLSELDRKVTLLNGSVTDIKQSVEDHTKDPHRERLAADSLTPSGVGLPGDIYTFANSGPWGGWSDPLYCPTGEVVCGLKQRVEQPIDGDDTAMNAVGFYCCPLKVPKAD